MYDLIHYSILHIRRSNTLFTPSCAPGHSARSRPSPPRSSLSHSHCRKYITNRQLHHLMRMSERSLNICYVTQKKTINKLSSHQPTPAQHTHVYVLAASLSVTVKVTLGRSASKQCLWEWNDHFSENNGLFVIDTHVSVVCVADTWCCFHEQ